MVYRKFELRNDHNANHGNALHGRHLIFCSVSFNGLIISEVRYMLHIIIIGQPLYPVVGRRPQHAVSKLPCLVLSSTRSCSSSICSGRLSTAWLVFLVVFSCHYGLQVVTREVHRSSLRRLICPAQDHGWVRPAFSLWCSLVVLPRFSEYAHGLWGNTSRTLVPSQSERFGMFIVNFIILNSLQL